MIKIYGLHTPHFLKVVYAAEELGLDFQIIPVDLTSGETKTPAHLARHPFGKVPVIEHNNKFVFESNAILRYMGNIANSKAFPSNPMARAHPDQWVEYFAHQAGRWCSSIWFQKCIGPKYFNETPNEALIAEHTEWLLADMPVVEQHMAKNTFLAGTDFTLADVVAHCGMRGFKEAGLPLGDFPNFIRWFEAVENRPTFKKALEKAEGMAKV